MAKKRAERPREADPDDAIGDDDAAEEEDAAADDAADALAKTAPDDRPLFARKFPRTDALDALVAAFSRGDYRLVRVEAPALASRSKDEAERRAALELRRRIDPDPVSVALVLIAVTLLAVLAFHYLTHNHAPAVSQ